MTTRGLNSRGMSPLYVELPPKSRAALDKLVVEASRIAGRPLTTADVVRRLIAAATRRGRID